jgi:predicted nucleic acid-binding protein
VRAEKEKDRLPPEEAIERCGKWFRRLDQGILMLVPEHEILGEAMKLSVDCKHPLQYCLYLAAARHLAAPLVTADEPFHKRIKSYYKKVSLLEGCETN